jgi:hypothetical protein
VAPGGASRAVPRPQAVRRTIQPEDQKTVWLWCASLYSLASLTSRKVLHCPEERRKTTRHENNRGSVRDTGGVWRRSSTYFEPARNVLLPICTRPPRRRATAAPASEKR